MNTCKNLVFMPLSDTNYSQYHTWVDGDTERNYHLMVNNWGNEGFLSQDSRIDYYHQIKDYKFKTLAKLYEDNFKQMFEYDYIMIPDPDLKTSIEDVNSMFEIMKDNELDLCHPSQKGYISHPIMSPHPDRNIIIRHLNIIETQCPIFSRKALLSCLWTFKMYNSCWGLDWAWPKIVRELSQFNNVGVLNHVTIEHTRPNESSKWDLTGAEFQSALERFDVKNLSFNFGNKLISKVKGIQMP